VQPPAVRFRRLLEPVHDRALAFARCLCRGSADGDDLFQEAALRAFARLDTLRDEAAFRAWLYQIIVSVHRSHCRRALWRRLIPFGAAAEAAVAGLDRDGHALYRTSAAPDAGDAIARADAALGKLPAVQREAIVLFEIEGWRVEEIAACQRVSVSAVKSRLARGRARLRRHYQKLLGAGNAPTLAGERS
jgi:RNA polymerase sigma-70 factor (ECF subfamily)